MNKKQIEKALGGKRTKGDRDRLTLNEKLYKDNYNKDYSNTKVKPIPYRGYEIHVRYNANGYYCVITKGGLDVIHIEDTPYRNDDESAIACAESLIDIIVRDKNRRIKMSRKIT